MALAAHYAGVEREGQEEEQTSRKGKSIYSVCLSCQGNLTIFLRFAIFINKFCLTTLQQGGHAGNIHIAFHFFFS